MVRGEGTDAGRDAVTALSWLRTNRDDLAGLPQPAGGSTIERWKALAAIGQQDLSLVRLAEGHVDALSILHELDRRDLGRDGCWGVWAAEPSRLEAAPVDAGWRLVGEKRWCSGSDGLDHALVTATAPDGPRLFAIDTDDAQAIPGSWEPIGMVATRSETMRFDAVVDRDASLGGPNAYVDRPGFWAGAMGVAACWFGGALGVADLLDDRCLGARQPHLSAVRGRVRSRLAGAAGCLTAAAHWLDAAARDTNEIRDRALALRLVVEECARAVLDDVTIAGGSSSLAFAPAHARRVVDLTVYVRQLDRHRTEAELGVQPSEAWPW